MLVSTAFFPWVTDAGAHPGPADHQLLTCCLPGAAAQRAASAPNHRLARARPAVNAPLEMLAPLGEALE
eukprot:15464648-Alexandrium_andersonii.AAC.1